jgi:hypothetical protein
MGRHDAAAETVGDGDSEAPGVSPFTTLPRSSSGGNEVGTQIAMGPRIYEN